jgi:hypothetical protein
LLRDLARRQTAPRLGLSTHSLQRPKQVHRRGTAGGQIIDHFLQSLEKRRLVTARRLLHSHTNAVCCRDADGRRAAHAQRLDGFPDALDVAAFDLLEFDRQ